MTSRLHLLYKKGRGGRGERKTKEKIGVMAPNNVSVIVLSVSGVPISVLFDCHRAVLVLLLCFAVLEQLSVYSYRHTKKEEKTFLNRRVFFVLFCLNSSERPITLSHKNRWEIYWILKGRGTPLPLEEISYNNNSGFLGKKP